MYHLNESSLVEFLLSAIYFLGFHQKKSGIFVSFPFSTLTRGVVNVGLAES